MASGDGLQALLEMAMREMPDVPTEVWTRFAALASLNFGGGEIYVRAGYRQRSRLEALAQVEADISAAQLAEKLGVSVRHAKRLRRLCRGG
ncbi:MAG: hypothetical protein HZC22_13325 [Rhodocyclales bacterium]|nr:hypothetical protein [Rhodocyclales bacterium]